MEREEVSVLAIEVAETFYSFSPLPRAATQDVDERGDFQSDLRMTYCACAISSMIGDSSALDALLATQVIRQCKVNLF